LSKEGEGPARESGGRGARGDPPAVRRLRDRVRPAKHVRPPRRKNSPRWSAISPRCRAS